MTPMVKGLLRGLPLGLVGGLLTIGLLVLLDGCAHGKWGPSRERPGVTWIQEGRR